MPRVISMGRFVIIGRKWGFIEKSRNMQERTDCQSEDGDQRILGDEWDLW